MKLIKYPNKILTTVSKEVEITDELVSLILEMDKKVKKGFGWGKIMGIAAPQLGHNIRVFFALNRWFINPKIIWETKAPKTLYYEGCYSLEENKFDYPVRRKNSIILRWRDFDGNTNEERFNGQNAQVILHELDHLNGKLCHEQSETVTSTEPAL